MKKHSGPRAPVVALLLCIVWIPGLGLSGPSAAVAQQRPEPTTSPGTAALFSAVVPGSGQYVQGQRRAWAYLALETVGWIAYFDRRAAGADYRDRYRDFAWLEARLQSTTRIDGDFDYYETLTKWQRSGRFDAQPSTPGVQPEADAATFNGAIWARASRLFIPDGVSVPESDPRYQQALDYYRERAYGPELLWDWTGTGDAQDEYASLIRASDQRFRQATNVLGLVVANHLVSMADAFVSARIPHTTMRSGVLPTSFGGGPVWTTRVEVRAPW